MNDRIFDFPWLRSQSVVQDPRTYVCGGYMYCVGVCFSCKVEVQLEVKVEVELGVEMCVCVWRICKEAGLVEGGGQREVMGGG